MDRRFRRGHRRWCHPRTGLRLPLQSRRCRHLRPWHPCCLLRQSGYAITHAGVILLVFASKGRDGLILIPSLFCATTATLKWVSQREFPYSLTLNFSWSLRSKRGIKICPLLFSILLLIHTAQFTRLLRSKRIGLLYPCACFVYCRGIQCRISFVSCPAYYVALLCIPPIGNRHRRLLFTRDTIPHVVSILLLAFCARDFQERDSSSISSVLNTDIASCYYLYYPIWQQNELSRTISSQKLAYLKKKL